MQSISQIMSQASFKGTATTQFKSTSGGMGTKRHMSIGPTTKAINVTPFKAQGSPSNAYSSLNATADNIRNSKRSLNSGSVIHVNRTMLGNESMGSFGMDQKRSMSLTIKELKQKQVKDVRNGYSSNLLFEHTIADIIKILEHKLGKSAISQADR